MDERSLSFMSSSREDFCDSTIGFSMTLDPFSTPNLTPTPNSCTLMLGPFKKTLETLYPYDPRDSPSCPITPQNTRYSEPRRSIHSPRTFGLNGLRRKEYSLSPFSRPVAPLPEEKYLEIKDLQKHTGESRPIWVGINNIVFDLSSNKAFYGPGQPFNFFAGKDISVRASVNLFDLSQDLSSQLTFESNELNSEQNRKLNTMCLDIYSKKYPVVGRIRNV